MITYIRRLLWRPTNYFFCETKIPHFAVGRLIRDRNIHDLIRLVLFQSEELTELEVCDISKHVLMYGTASQIYDMLQIFPFLGMHYKTAFLQLHDLDVDDIYGPRLVEDLKVYGDSTYLKDAEVIFAPKRAKIIQLYPKNQKGA